MQSLVKEGYSGFFKIKSTRIISHQNDNERAEQHPQHQVTIDGFQNHSFIYFFPFRNLDDQSDDNELEVILCLPQRKNNAIAVKFGKSLLAIQ